MANHWLGRKHTEESKRKMSLAHKGKLPWSAGKKLSEDHKRKIGLASKGRLHDDEWKKQASERVKKEWADGKRKPIHHSLETRLKMSQNRKCEKGNNWQGGISTINNIIRGSLEYKLWRSAVFERDNWTCQNCLKRGIELNAHHILPFSKYPEGRFAINNGITLCKECHTKVS